MADPSPRASLWSADSDPHGFRPLAGTTRADVLVVGAGMTGLLTAARLADSGLDVVVVDAGPIGGRNTVMSTGNLYAPVSRLADLIARWGGDTARRVVQWRQHAVRSIETLVHRYDLHCGFERVAMQGSSRSRSSGRTILMSVPSACASSLPTRSTRRSSTAPPSPSRVLPLTAPPPRPAPARSRPAARTPPPRPARPSPAPAS